MVEGQLGESSRFYPARPLFKALTGKPVALSSRVAYACARCGLTWADLDAQSLQSNIQSYGLSPHGTGVMRIVDGERTGQLKAQDPP